jgi:RNA polymerase sigma factor (sigma-70 family)
MDSPVTLSDLAALSLPSRAARLMALGRTELTAALAAVAPVHAAVGLDRLAWAVAFNVDTLLRPRQDTTKAPPVHARSDTPWPSFWAVMSAPRGSEREAASLLCDLARSVACERRGDWQPPGTTIDRDQAADSFDEVYARLEYQIVAYARTRLMDGEDPESIASMTWASMYATYWSEEAQKRFGAHCSIRAMLRVICTRQALNTQRRHNSRSEKVSLDDPNFDDALLPPLRYDMPDPFGHDEARKAQLRRCITALRGRQAVFAQMVWIEGRTQAETARLCGTTAPNVHQTLDRAFDALKAMMAPAGAPGDDR